jgi:hypothetical protein
VNPTLERNDPVVKPSTQDARTPVLGPFEGSDDETPIRELDTDFGWPGAAGTEKAQEATVSRSAA